MTGTWLGIDVGTVRVGVAKSDPSGILATPLGTLARYTRDDRDIAELAALVQERCFYHLEAPVERVTGFDTPYPHSLEWAYFPGPIRIGEALDKLLGA